MNINYFFQGLTIGLAYVAPIGAQNLFVIETALQQSKKRSLITLALACFFGIGSLMDKFQILKMIILLAEKNKRNYRTQRTHLQIARGTKQT
ncbi:hypothetical protein JYG23_04075 [Sedimentibacter sp. zth1]|nr:hypothetical protein JYG23_04075 [Sedimentibacter sp. zth1]